MNRKCVKRFGVVCLVIAIGAWPAWRLVKFGGRIASIARDVATPLPPGSLCPQRDDSTGSSTISTNKTPRGQAAIALDSTQELMGNERGQPVIHPRVAIAKLYAGKDIEDVNAKLRSITPWKESGSTWFGHPSGDYDFTEIDLVALLYLFFDQPGKLHPETEKYLVDILLIENGATPRPMVPHSLGLVVDTENHTLMTEGTRYLKNQWYYQRGTPDQRGNPKFDNDRNGLGLWLLGYLRVIQNAGFQEFNSIPYLSYGMRALLNLEAFPANREIRSTARYIIDIANWQYALGSLDMRRCAPFRRQSYRAGITDLQDDEHTPFMQVWACNPSDPSPTPPFRLREETLAEAMPYRLPEAVRQWALAKPETYFVRFGHGQNASPELYSGGPNYLISAGGVNRGLRSEIAARPIALMLRDGVRDLNDCFHLTGCGTWKKWNNTGVCDRFACSNGEVHVPKNKSPVASSGNWNIHAEPNAPGFMIAVHNAAGLALLALFPEWKNSPEDLAKALAQSNPNAADLSHTFHWPTGETVDYDVNAPKGLWVITAIDGKPVDRAYDSWAQLDGNGPKISFAR